MKKYVAITIWKDGRKVKVSASISDDDYHEIKKLLKEKGFEGGGVHTCNGRWSEGPCGCAMEKW